MVGQIPETPPGQPGAGAAGGREEEGGVSSSAEGPAEGLRTRQLGMLEAAMQQLGEGVIIADLGGRFVFWNAVAESIIGRDQLAAAAGERPVISNCFLPDGVTPYPPEQLPLTLGLRGEHVDNAEVFIHDPNAPEGIRIVVNGGPLRGVDGELTGGAVLFRDITAQRRSDELLRRLSMAVERTTDGVFITDVKAVIEYVNPAFEAMTGYSRDRVIGRPASILKSGLQEPGFYRELWTSILSGKVHSATLLNRRRDGSLFHAEQTITPVLDETSNLIKFVSVMRDITDLIRAKEQDVEMRLARTVQQKFYPIGPPELAGFDLAGAAFPADQTCGDYYDFLPMSDGRLGIAMGDVSGHGFSAALLMAKTRAYLRAVARASMGLNDTLSALNAFLFEDTESERFVTLMLVLLDPVRRSIVYSSAGHVDGYVLNGSGNLKHVLRSTGPALGIFGRAEFPPSPELPLASGDLLLLLTDGIGEARREDGAFFETGRSFGRLLMRGKRMPLRSSIGFTGRTWSLPRTTANETTSRWSCARRFPETAAWLPVERDDRQALGEECTGLDVHVRVSGQSRGPRGLPKCPIAGGAKPGGPAGGLWIRRHRATMSPSYSFTRPGSRMPAHEARGVECYLGASSPVPGQPGDGYGGSRGRGMTASWLEIVFVLLTGLGQFLVAGWLEPQLAFVVGASLFWAGFVVIRERDAPGTHRVGVHDAGFRPEHGLLLPIMLLAPRVRRLRARYTGQHDVELAHRDDRHPLSLLGTRPTVPHRGLACRELEEAQPDSGSGSHRLDGR